MADDQLDEQLKFDAGAPCEPVDGPPLIILDNMYGRLEVSGCLLCRHGFVKNDRGEWIMFRDIIDGEPALAMRIIKAALADGG